MIDEALKTLFNTAVQARSVEVLQLPQCPPYARMVMHRATGEVVQIDAPRMPRGDTLVVLEDLAAAVRDAEPDSAAVFVGQAGIVAVLDQSGRRVERITMPLTPCQAWMELTQRAQQRRPQAHAEFIQTLRLKFAGCADAEFVSTIRSITFDAAASGASDVGVGDKAVSKTVRERMYARGKPIPEEVRFTLPAVFTELESYEVNIRCLLDVDTSDQTFLLVPLAGEMEGALRKTLLSLQQQLRTLLAETKVPVYCGAFGYTES